VEKEQFAEIMKEYGYSNEQIDIIWVMLDTDDLDEATVRNGAANAKLP